MTLTPHNPMVRALVALVSFEVVVFGLGIAVMIMISQVPPLTAGLAGGAAALLALASAGTLRRPVGFYLGWLAQAAGVALGLLTPAMYLMGGLFALLWVLTFVLGKRLEQQQ